MDLAEATSKLWKGIPNLEGISHPRIEAWMLLIATSEKKSDCHIFLPDNKADTPENRQGGVSENET